MGNEYFEPSRWVVGFEFGRNRLDRSQKFALDADIDSPPFRHVGLGLRLVGYRCRSIDGVLEAS